MSFSDDSSYYLLCSLEVIGENGELKRKADMFTKRTIKPHIKVTSVETASEALAVSIGDKARVDMPYMCSLSGKTEQVLFEELKGTIFLNPLHTHEHDGQDKYLTADEYLSGNVREKLALAKRSAELYPEDYNINVEYLEKVQPKDLDASEISVRLGATWLPTDDVQDFIFETLRTPRYCQYNMKVNFSPLTGEWAIKGKSYDRMNVMAENTYGTPRINAYKIIEDTLNLKDVRIFDYVEDEYGNCKPVLNKKETAIAQGKQEMIKQAFQDWIWKDPERKERLCRMYNDTFNSMRAREYDGSHITFSGMNPEIKLREHQVNAVARIMYGGNSLLAHVVGAGKTFTMVAAAQESKRLGLCNKSLIVVPNHLTEQWATEYLQLYPSANILVATKKDFETKNRKLIAKGVPENEIAFIHNADTEAKKKELFSKVREGQIRVLIGSTAKMGAGTNVQKKLIAIHHTDCPWRPADLQQREGRIIRQGNENPEVEIYSYVTEETFDAYLYQLVENKQKFIGQIMTSKSPVRSAEDVDEQALSYR